jgi:hypothetical protein
LRPGKRTALAVVSAMIAASAAAVSAHRRDEYLQAARIGIEPARVEIEIDLTPGIAVSDAIVGEIDRDHDRRLSDEEKRDYVNEVLGAVTIRVDGRHVRLEPVASAFPDPDAFRRGEGTVRIRSAADVAGVSRGEHQLSFSNRLRPDVSVYLANALAPASDRIRIEAQRRDPEQRDLTIDYTVRRAGFEPARASLLFVVVFGALVTARMVRRN